jgi:hypothetical protein
MQTNKKQTKSRALRPQANYTDWATATCPWNLMPTSCISDNDDGFNKFFESVTIACSLSVQFFLQIINEHWQIKRPWWPNLGNSSFTNQCTGLECPNCVYRSTLLMQGGPGDFWMMNQIILSVSTNVFKRVQARFFIFHIAHHTSTYLSHKNVAINLFGFGPTEKFWLVT